MAATNRVHRMPVESEAPDHHHHHHHHHHHNSHAGAVPLQPPRWTMSSGKRHGGADELTGQSHRTRHRINSSGTGCGSGTHQITSEAGGSINYNSTVKSSSDYSLERLPDDQGRQRSHANIVPDKRKSSDFSSSSTSDKGHRKHTSNGSNSHNNQYSSDHHQHVSKWINIPIYVLNVMIMIICVYIYIYVAWTVMAAS